MSLFSLQLVSQIYSCLTWYPRSAFTLFAFVKSFLPNAFLIMVLFGFLKIVKHATLLIVQTTLETRVLSAHQQQDIKVGALRLIFIFLEALANSSWWILALILYAIVPTSGWSISCNIYFTFVPVLSSCCSNFLG